MVNHDGRDGTAPDPLVWSAGAHPKRRRLVHAVRDRASLPGPPGIWDSEWVHVPASAICAEDIAHWPYTTGLLVKWLPFWALCIGLLVVWILELVVFLMRSCSFFVSFWAGERGCLLRELILVIFGQGVQFQCRLFRFVQALIFGALVDSLLPL